MEYRPYRREDLPAILDLCLLQGWREMPDDPALAHRVLTNPGVTTCVAVEWEQVVGYAYLLSDGGIQAYLVNVLVAPECRRQGIGRRLIHEAFSRCGARRLDLLSLSDAFYGRLRHSRLPGFRLYPPFVDVG